VVDVAGHPAASAWHGLLVLVNPIVVQAVGREVVREGCQSLPQFAVDVARARRIVAASDLHAELWSTGFEARAIQHEIDHLAGILILDRAATARAIHRRPAVTSPERRTSPPARAGASDRPAGPAPP
jgi:peptide deformylase